jgi:hypothetical protein
MHACPGPVAMNVGFHFVSDGRLLGRADRHGHGPEIQSYFTPSRSLVLQLMQIARGSAIRTRSIERKKEPGQVSLEASWGGE